MAEELKELIARIQEEGVKAAEDKAKKIEGDARRRADEIISQAEKDSRLKLARAVDEIAKAESGSRTALKQAGRDLLLELRKEVCAVLDRIVLRETKKTLTPDEMVKIIGALIKETVSKSGLERVIISLNKEDLDKMEKAFLSGLSGELKKAITLAGSEEIGGGFTISYDSGRSYYDFTDKALAEYLSTRLKPQLAELLKGAA